MSQGDQRGDMFRSRFHQMDRGLVAGGNLEKFEPHWTKQTVSPCYRLTLLLLEVFLGKELLKSWVT
jgi:hypothetical protein